MVRAEELTSPRFVANRPADIWITHSEDGTGVVPSAATVAIVDAAGTVVQATVGATIGAAGKVSYALTAAQNIRPRALTATWTLTSGGLIYTYVTTHEAVGDVLFTEAEARVAGAGANQAAPLASETRYPDELLTRLRDSISDAFEDILGFPVGGRGIRYIADGDGSPWLELTDIRITRVRAVSERTSGSSTWTAYDASALADIQVYPDGRLFRETLGSFATGYRNVAVEYEAGLTPVPLELRRAGLRLLLYQFVESNIPDRALSITNQQGNINLATAGRNGAWFGLPEVDAVLTRLRRKRPGIG